MHAAGQVNERGETVDEKIKKLDEELARYKDQIRKTRPGPSQEAIKARVIRLLKHKRMYSTPSPSISVTVTAPLPFVFRLPDGRDEGCEQRAQGNDENGQD